ncbi:MAG: hypothetical protein HGB19_06415 [Chlorobiales bacterium]|jgi:hypothetical protein|nr:hypothetical protein [Chlorobiales bacterium]
MKNYVAVFVGALCFCGGAIAYGGENMLGIAGKDFQKKPAKVEAPAQSQPMQKVDPRELIARDSLKSLNKWLDAEKDYRVVREQIRLQDEQLLLFKEHQDKAGKVLELYKTDEAKEPAQISEQKDSEKSLRDAEKGYENALKEKDKLKEKLVAAEKRYNLAERAYKIYNPSLSGVAGLELRKSMGDTSAVAPQTK